MSHTVRVEIAHRPSTLSNEEMETIIFQFLTSFDRNLPIKRFIKFAELALPEDIVAKRAIDAFESMVILDPIGSPAKKNFQFLFYKINEIEGEIEYIENGQSDGEVEAGTHWILPCREFEGLYESLIYEEGLKERLLASVETQIRFSQRGVNPIIISNNRLSLLWGPPGTGKTSLCKALAQKLSIRARNMFEFTHLIEINCHSLFSKWFSESGKLVSQMFQRILELIENPKALVCVLIDEVESIAYSRANVGSNEPTDSLRVVNAVLTQLDRIRRYSNVLILTTSNVASAIDAAFLDRADIVQFIGSPTLEAIQHIYVQCLYELRRVDILNDFPDFPDDANDENNGACMISPEYSELIALSRISCGLSGRNARKVAFLAHATIEPKEHIPVLEFLEAMREAAEKLINEKKSAQAEALGNEIYEIPQYLPEVELPDLQILDTNGFSVVNHHHQEEF